MFDLNFISDPGVQKEGEPAVWSFLPKDTSPETTEKIDKPPVKPVPVKNSFNWNPWGFLTAGIVIIGFYLFQEGHLFNTIVATDKVLNQVVDLIVEGSYLTDLKLEKVVFNKSQAVILLQAEKMEVLKRFNQGFYPDENIPYQIYQSGDNYFLSLQMPWQVNPKEGGDIDMLKSLTKKTVFSNKVSLDFSDNEFEIKGRSADIISFLLNLAKNGLIQEYGLVIQQMDAGVFVLKALIQKS